MNNGWITIGINWLWTFGRRHSGLIADGKASQSHLGKLLAKLLRKRPVDEFSGGLAEILELSVITRSSILQAEYVKEVLTAQRQVDVFTEAFDNGPALADGCSTLEEQVIPARGVEQGF